MAFRTCVSVGEKTPKKLQQTIKRALQKSDYIEIRFDFLQPKDIPTALESLKKNLARAVCTVRPKSEGGKFSGKEPERISIIKLIAEFDPYLLDLEFNTIKKNRLLYQSLVRSKSNILVSWHDFKRTPNSTFLLKLRNQMKNFSENIKIVSTANSNYDVSRILSLYNGIGKTNLIAFSMGFQGRISRILCLYLGSPFTYVSLGKPIAPGQYSIDEIRSILISQKIGLPKKISKR